jgi:hypothetical protein
MTRETALELEGFRRKARRAARNCVDAEYVALGRGDFRCLKFVRHANSNVFVTAMEGAAVPDFEHGWRVSAVRADEALSRRLLNAMAIIHFEAKWLCDGLSDIDVQMIRRGFSVGVLATGERVWSRADISSRVFVFKTKSKELPSSTTDGITLILAGADGHRVTVGIRDFTSLVEMLDGDIHYKLFKPGVDIEIAGLSGKDSFVIQ